MCGKGKRVCVAGVRAVSVSRSDRRRLFAATKRRCRAVEGGAQAALLGRWKRDSTRWVTDLLLTGFSARGHTAASPRYYRRSKCRRRRQQQRKCGCKYYYKMVHRRAGDCAYQRCRRASEGQPNPLITRRKLPIIVYIILSIPFPVKTFDVGCSWPLTRLSFHWSFAPL